MLEPLIPGGLRHLACWQVSWLAARIDVRLDACLPVHPPTSESSLENIGQWRGASRPFHRRSLQLRVQLRNSALGRAPDSLLIHPTSRSGRGTKQAYAKNSG